jgi:serine/threonine-protein kinase
MVQWALAYAAGAWVVVQLLDAVSEPLSLSPPLQLAILILLVVGFLIALVVAWYHGEKGRQRVSGPELLMVAALLVVAGVAISMVGPKELTTEPDFPIQVVQGEGPPRVAVLPCTNESPDPSDAFRAGGLHDEILLKLQRISSLASIGRASVLQFGVDQTPTHVVASTLSVDYVGECSVQRSGDRIRVIFQLMDSRGQQVWADVYDRELTIDILDIQIDIAEKVAQAIGATLTPEEEALISSIPTENLDAFEAYQLGKYHLQRRDNPAEAFPEAMRYFELALEEDPGLAQAHGGMAVAYNILASFGLTAPREAWQASKQWAESALALDSTIADAHLMIADFHLVVDRNLEEAERRTREAIKVQPGYEFSHRLYADLLLNQGRFAEAERELAVAQSLDPLGSQTLSVRAKNAFFSRRFELAKEIMGDFEDAEAFNLTAAGWLGLSFLALGEPENLDRLFPEDAPIWESENLEASTARALVLAMTGEPDTARVQLDRIVSAYEATNTPNDPGLIPDLYALLGDADGAFRWMDRSIEGQAYSTVRYGVDPFLDPVRSDPRFEDVLGRIGLAGKKELFDSLASARPVPVLQR